MNQEVILTAIIAAICYLIGYNARRLKINKALDEALKISEPGKDGTYTSGWLDCLSFLLYKL